MARRKKQGRKRQPPAGGRPVLLLMAVSIIVVLAIIFLTVLGVIETGVAAVLAMTLLAAIFFLMWLRTSAPQGGDQRRKRRRKPSMKLHAGEPQPEYVKFKEDLGRSELKKAPEPVLYPVRKELIVESGQQFGPKHAELSVRNIRRSSRRKKKRVDYTKYFDDDEFDF